MSATAKVFISATSQDLGRYRRAVSDSLVTTNVLPVDQEHTVHDFRTIAQMLRRRIAGCNAMICLLGRVYGREPVDVPPGTPRRSYTQMEYDIATELGLPIFRFVAADDCPVDAVDEPDELRTLQTEHRRRVTGGDHIWSFFRSVEDLKTQVGLLRFDPHALQPGMTRQLAVIFVAELVDMVAQRRRLGEEAWVANVLCPYQELLRQSVVRHHGSVTGETPGEYLVNFESTAAAVEAALQLHRAVRGRSWALEPPAVRIAIHLGQVLQFGGVDESRTLQASTTVETCRELVSLAEAGQTLLTQVAFDNARQSALALSGGEPGGEASPAAEQHGLAWHVHGRYAPVGVEAEPLEVCEVGFDGEAPLRAPPGTQHFRPADSLEEQQMRGWRPSIGQAIPRQDDWIIQSKLGEGGFGEVWLAQHRRMKLRRVFKFCFDSERLRSFKRELTLFKLLQQQLGQRDDIAGLEEISTDQPPFYLKSEYVEAGNLAEWARGLGGIERVPLHARLQLLAEIATAVAAAHSVGVIHKDLKPSNVLIVPRDGVPHPRLADFGIGVLTDRTLLQAHHITEMGFTQTLLGGNESSRTGSRMYAPPESLTGKPATTASDVFALGVMLYQFAIGDLDRPLGTGWEEEVGDELLREDIRACTHADPTQRLSAAAELSQRLTQRESRNAARAQQRRAVEEAQQAALRARQQAERARRMRQWTIATAAALAAMAGLAVFGFAQWHAAARNAAAAKVAESQAQENAAAAVAQKLQADQARARSEQMLNSSRAALAYAAWQAHDMQGARANLDDCDPAYRGWEWRYCDRLCNASLRVLRGHQGPVNAVAFSTDGSQVISAGNDGTARVWDYAEAQASLQEKFRFTAHTKPVRALAIHPDGKRIATAGDDEVVLLWELATGNVLARLPHRGVVRSLAFDAAGARLASVTQVDAGQNVESELKIWNVANFMLCGLRHCDGAFINSVTFNPSGTRLVTTGADGVGIWDPQNGNRLETIAFSSREASTRDGPANVSATAVAFHPFAPWFASAWSNGQVQFHRMSRAGNRGMPAERRHRDDARLHRGLGNDEPSASAEGVVTIWPHEGVISRLAFTADGGTLAAACYDGAVALVQMDDPLDRQFDPEARELINWQEFGHNKIWGHEGTANGVAAHPREDLLASGGSDGTVRLWHAGHSDQEGFPVHRLAPIEVEERRWTPATFTPQGERVLLAANDRLLALDALTGQPGRYPLGAERPWPLAFSPDGRRTAYYDARPSPESKAATAAATPSKDQGAIVVRDGGGEGTSRRIDLEQAVRALAFSFDGELLAALLADHSLRIFDARTGQPRVLLQDDAHNIVAFAFHPTRRELAMADSDGMLRIRDCGTAWMVAQWKAHDPAVRRDDYEPDARSVAYYPDGKRLITSCGGEVRIWDARTGTPLFHLPRQNELVAAVTVSPDGQRIVTGSGRWVKFWDADGFPIPSLTLAGNHTICGLQFNRAGTVLAALDPAVGFWESPPALPADERLRLVQLVGSIARERLLAEDVAADLRARSDLAPASRDYALQLLRGRFLSPEALDRRLWMIVQSPGSPQDVYRRACDQAGILFRRYPQAGGRAHVPLTLAMAQYRLGRYPEALQTLTAERPPEAASRYPATALAGPSPDMAAALRGMCLWKLGRRDEAFAACAKETLLPRLIVDTPDVEAFSDCVASQVRLVEVEGRHEGSASQLSVCANVQGIPPDLEDEVQANLLINGQPQAIAPQRMPGGETLVCQWPAVPVTESFYRVVVTTQVASGGMPLGEAVSEGRIAAAPSPPRLHSLILATNTVKDSQIPRLQFAEFDAQRVVAWLQGSSAAAETLRDITVQTIRPRPADTTHPVTPIYRRGVERRLLGQAFTRQATEQAIGEFQRELAGAGRDDLLLVFFSGQGFVLPPAGSKRQPDAVDDFCLCAYDLERDHLDASSLHWSVLRRLRHIPCRTLFLLDACHAGQAIEYERRQAATAGDGACFIFAACGPQQVAREQAELGGLFTYSLLRGLNTPAGFVGLDDLRSFTAQELSVVRNKHGLPEQDCVAWPEDLIRRSYVPLAPPADSPVHSMDLKLK